MTQLWPRLPLSEASRLFERVRAGEALIPSVSNANQTFAAVGSRARPSDVEELQTAMRQLVETDPPQRTLVGEAGTDFDRRAAAVIHRHVDVTWSEASSRELWSFIALVALPDLTELRWAHMLPQRNEERWIGRDLTRHTWGRLWWHVAAFGERTDLLARLNESDLNQLVERRSIGGHAALLTAVVEAFLEAVDDGAPRRSLVRDVSKRLLRRLPYIDDLSMTEADLRALSTDLVRESLIALNR